MQAKEMLHLREILSNEGVVFCYSGYMTENVLLSIGSVIKQKLAADEADKRVVRGVFSVFVEQVQNVIRYSMEKEVVELDDNEMDLRFGLLMVGCKDDNYFVACGNMVEKKDVDRLRTSLSHIQTLDKDGLKALHKATLKSDTPESSKGAAVGFIDIARRASRGFDFDFMDMSDTHAFFFMKAYI